MMFDNPTILLVLLYTQVILLVLFLISPWLPEALLKLFEMFVKLIISTIAFLVLVVMYGLASCVFWVKGKLGSH